ncbi:MAG: HD domain-containing phosphohydrolase [Thermodesulfobacteriota bacterium]
MKVLFVDDDEKVLAMLRRNLSRRFHLDTSSDPSEALSVVKLGGVAVVVTDLRMPRMDGFEFLAKVSEISPLTVKIMLTGHADLDAAIAGVNEGHLFRFLTKPCSTETLIKSVEAALEQYRLVTAEKELLRGTLQGCIKVLTEILAQTNPEAFGRSERISRHMKNLAARLGVREKWKIELASMLSQIGCIFIPEEIVSRDRCLTPLPAEERQIFEMHPHVGAQLLSSIPRLEEVREIILHQEDGFAEHAHIPYGARMLKICLDYDKLEACGGSVHDVMAAMRKQAPRYDPAILDAFERYVCEDTGFIRKELGLRELREGMILAEDVRTPENLLLLAKGLEVNQYSLMRLHNLAKTHGVRQPFAVLVPIAPPRQEG